MSSFPKPHSASWDLGFSLQFDLKAGLIDYLRWVREYGLADAGDGRQTSI